MNDANAFSLKKSGFLGHCIAQDRGRIVRKHNCEYPRQRCDLVDELGCLDTYRLFLQALVQGPIQGTKRESDHGADRARGAALLSRLRAQPPSSMFKDVRTSSFNTIGGIGVLGFAMLPRLRIRV